MMFKVVLLGEAGVGKSTLVYTVKHGTFPHVNSSSTVGADFCVQKYTMQDNNKIVPIDVHIWDTAGQERYRSMIRMYYRDTHCFVLILNVQTPPEQMINDCEYWLNEISEHATYTTPHTDTPDYSVWILINKIDCNPSFVIPPEILIHRSDHIFVETISCKNYPAGTSELFHEMAIHLYEVEVQSRQQTRQQHKNSIILQIDKLQSKCCNI